MKKFLVLLMAFAAGALAVKSYAQASTPVAASVATPVNPAAVASEPSTLADTSGVPNDQDLSWKTSIEDKGITSDDDAYQAAHDQCVAFGKAFTDAHALRADGKWLEAAQKVPYSWIKACYLYNYAASLVAEKDDDGEWKYSPDKITESGDKAIKYFNMAKSYSDKAVSAGITGTGANATEPLNARIAGGLKAIDDVQHPKPVKHKKKKPASDDDSDEN